MQCLHAQAAAAMRWVCFYEFIKDENVRLIGCEAAGRGVNTGETAATIAVGTEGIFHGMNHILPK